MRPSWAFQGHVGFGKGLMTIKEHPVLMAGEERLSGLISSFIYNASQEAFLFRTKLAEVMSCCGCILNDCHDVDGRGWVMMECAYA